MISENIRSLRLSLDPVLWAQETFGLELDPWQIDAMRSRDKRMLFNCSRQSGKSTIAAIKALHRVIYYPRSLVLLISPSQRQSSELFRKVLSFLNVMKVPPKLQEENKLSLTLSNGSRIVSLPSSEATIRGYSNASLIIEDEAAAVPDELYQACLPMLAVSNGQYILLSTPRGKKGHFFHAWESQEWKKIRITASDIPRISITYLENAKRELGSRMYSQEFGCTFLEDIEGSMFRREWFDIVDAVPADLNKTRRWDLAAGGNDWTAGVLLGEAGGQYWILDVQHAKLPPGGNERLIRQTAISDGEYVPVRIEQEPGSSGVALIDRYARDVLKGFDFAGVRATGSKVVRAQPFAAACEAHNVKLLRAPWNREFLDELCSFPLGDHDDMVDAASGAFHDLYHDSSDDDEYRNASPVGVSSIPSDLIPYRDYLSGLPNRNVPFPY
jgi:predicted phage terminase large subunit-like protein